MPEALTASEVFERAAAEMAAPAVDGHFCDRDEKDRRTASRRAMAWIRPYLTTALEDIVTALPEYAIMNKLTEGVLRSNGGPPAWSEAFLELSADMIEERVCRESGKRSVRGALLELMAVIADGETLYSASFELASMKWPKSWSTTTDKADAERRTALVQALTKRVYLDYKTTQLPPDRVQLQVVEGSFDVAVNAMKKRSSTTSMTTTVDAGDVVAMRLQIRAPDDVKSMRSESLISPRVPRCIISTWSEVEIPESSSGQTLVDLPVFVVTHWCSPSEKIEFDVVSSDHQGLTHVSFDVAVESKLGGLVITEIQVDQDAAGFSEALENESQPSAPSGAGVVAGTVHQRIVRAAKTEFRLAVRTLPNFRSWALGDVIVAVADERELLSINDDDEIGVGFVDGETRVKGDVDVMLSSREEDAIAFAARWASRDPYTPLSNSPASLWIRLVGITSLEGDDGEEAGPIRARRRKGRRAAQDRDAGNGEVREILTREQSGKAKEALLKIASTASVQFANEVETRDLLGRLVDVGVFTRDGFESVVDALDRPSARSATIPHSIRRDLRIAAALLESGVSANIVRRFVSEAAGARPRSIGASLEAAALALVAQLGADDASASESAAAAKSLVNSAFSADESRAQGYSVVRYVQIPVDVDSISR